jgi:hypothetical protein
VPLNVIAFSHAPQAGSDAHAVCVISLEAASPASSTPASSPANSSTARKGSLRQQQATKSSPSTAAGSKHSLYRITGSTQLLFVPAEQGEPLAQDPPAVATPSSTKGAAAPETPACRAPQAPGEHAPHFSGSEVVVAPPAEQQRRQQGKPSSSSKTPLAGRNTASKLAKAKAASGEGSVRQELASTKRQGSQVRREQQEDLQAQSQLSGQGAQPGSTQQQKSHSKAAGACKQGSRTGKQQPQQSRPARSSSSQEEAAASEQEEGPGVGAHLASKFDLLQLLDE